MAAQYVVQKNIPIPTTRGGGRSKGELRLILESMAVGESVRVSGKSRKSLYSKAYDLTPKKFITRLDGDAVRIWRVK